MKFGLGLYTIYDCLRKDWRAALTAARDAGCEGVEFFGEPDYPPEELQGFLKNTGLSLCGWHVEWRHFSPAELEKTLEYHQRAGTPVLIIPALGGPWEIGHSAAAECREVWLRHAEEMNRLDMRVRDAGMLLGYHTHAHEFTLRYGGKRVWDILKEQLAPDILLELDTGNCLEGGSNPAAELDGRSRFLHAKPYSHKNGFDQPFGEPEDENDWGNIVRAARKAGTEWMLIESEAEGLNRLRDAKRAVSLLRKLSEEQERNEMI